MAFTWDCQAEDEEDDSEGEDDNGGEGGFGDDDFEDDWADPLVLGLVEERIRRLLHLTFHFLLKVGLDPRNYHPPRNRRPL